jgi:tellurite resistance protein
LVLKKEKQIIDQKLADFLTEVLTELESNATVEKIFDDLVNPNLLQTDNGVISKESVLVLSDTLNEYGLRSEPQLNLGYVKHNIYAPLIFYKNEGDINLSSVFYKFARLATRIAVIMILADGKVHKQELQAIEKLIWSMSGITNRDKVYLLAKARYLLIIDQASDESYLDYVKISLSRDSVMVRMADLSDGGKQHLLSCAKDIAISDGFLHNSELSFFKEIYRVLELPIRNVKKDLLEHANKKFMTLDTHSTFSDEVIDPAFIEEVDDILNELFSDF